MPIKEFIENQYNSGYIQDATRQEEQLGYFTSSKLQDYRVDGAYVGEWVNRQYQSNDYFLNWVKTVFKTDVFLSFFKYLRFPLPSARICKNKIEPQLRRVFNAEDSDFKYSVKGKDQSDYLSDLNVKKFNQEIFERLLYKHNSLIVSDLDSVVANKPKRYFVDIKNVVSILEKEDKVWKIAYKGSVEIDGKIEVGFIYIDSERYVFLDKDHNILLDVLHDLGYTPVHFISGAKFNFNFVVRESIYSFVREELEEYSFYKNMQKMTEPRGVIPAVTKIQTEDTNAESEGIRGDVGQPNSDAIMGSQQSKIYSQNKTVGTGDLDPLVIHEIPIAALKDNDGKIDTSAVKDLETDIVNTVVGGTLESNESAKNQDQIKKSLSVLDNTLNSLGETINRIRKLSDTDMLSLKYGKDLVEEVFIHTGTDFFLDSESQLFEDLGKAPNALERKTLIVKINKNRYKNNQDISLRQTLLYDLMPYVADIDFDRALSAQAIDPFTIQYQLRFNHWISVFESNFGDIVIFFLNLESPKSEKLSIINNLILEIIKTSTNGTDNKEENSPHESGEGS